MLHILESHLFIGKENLGWGSINQGKFKYLYVLLKCSMDEKILEFQVYGDIEITINWNSKYVFLWRKKNLK
jgi:hypothetical protein